MLSSYQYDRLEYSTALLPGRLGYVSQRVPVECGPCFDSRRLVSIPFSEFQSRIPSSAVGSFSSRFRGLGFPPAKGPRVCLTNQVD